MAHSHRRTRRLLWAAALIVFLLLASGGLLALDLANQGLAWQALYAATGETSPTGQIPGFITYVGGLLRPPLDLALDVPVNHADVSPFGVNTFLEQEVEPAKRERQMQLIAGAGFDWIRQQFVWEDIEIHGRGDFTDRRNEPAGIDAWAKYDQIVDLAEQYGVEIQARLGNPPQWAQTAAGDFAPPASNADFAAFATAVAERYRGRIHVYQVWNEPNIYPEWGEQPVDPEAFTALLCETYAALKAVDPDIVVVAPALSPTLALTGRDLNEFIYLERMYEAGAGACFDVLAAQGYGFFSGPTDQRLQVFEQNFGRQQYLRELMVRHGDADKALWISEAGWNAIDAPEVPADVTAREGFGVVTPEQAAEYLPQAYDRVIREFPYIGAMNAWYFKPASDAARGQSWYYFRMLEPDFTPMPVYDAMARYLLDETPGLYRGVHQFEDWAIASDAPQTVSDETAQFGRAVETTGASFQTTGTNVLLRLKGDAPAITIDGQPAQPVAAYTDADGWTVLELTRSAWPETHAITLQAAAPVVIDSVQVLNTTARWMQPVVLACAAVLLVFVIGLLWALWQRFSD